MRLMSPRMTVWNQTLESSPISTSPMTVAPSATNTLEGQTGAIPLHGSSTGAFLPKRIPDIVPAAGVPPVEKDGEAIGSGDLYGPCPRPPHARAPAAGRA